MSPVTGRHHAIKEIHTSGDALDDIAGSADSHQVPRLAFWHIFLDRFDGVIHLLMGLPYRKPADCITGQIQLCDLFHMFDPQIMKYSTLIDAKQHLAGIDGILLGIVFRQRRFTAKQPTMRPVTGF